MGKLTISVAIFHSYVTVITKGYPKMDPEKCVLQLASNASSSKRNGTADGQVVDHLSRSEIPSEHHMAHCRSYINFMSQKIEIHVFLQISVFSFPLNSTSFLPNSIRHVHHFQAFSSFLHQRRLPQAVIGPRPLPVAPRWAREIPCPFSVEILGVLHLS